MNKQSPEYIRVHDDLMKVFNDEDLIESMLLIQGIAILADNQELPEYLMYPAICDEVQQNMLSANFKKVI